MSSEWQVKNGRLAKTFEFVDFRSALEFVNRLSEIAEARDHHPDIHIHSYKKVEIGLITHEKGGVTDKDHAMAKEIDKLS